MDTPTVMNLAENEKAPALTVAAENAAADKVASDQAASDKKEYRTYLLSLQCSMQSEYDKALLTLSGGAFGVTALFVKDLIGTQKAKSSTLLFLAWLALAFSMIAVIASYFTSASAMEKAVNQNDDGTIHRGNAGGAFNFATQVLNILAGFMFFSGVVLFAIFVLINL